MAIFNFSTNLTSVADIMPIADQASGGLLGFVLYIIIGVASLIVTSSFGFKESAMASTFILFTASLFLRYLGLLGDFYVFLAVCLMILSMISAILSKPGGATEA